MCLVLLCWGFSTKSLAVCDRDRAYYWGYLYAFRNATCLGSFHVHPLSGSLSRCLHVAPQTNYDTRIRNHACKHFLFMSICCCCIWGTHENQLLAQLECFQVSRLSWRGRGLFPLTCLSFQKPSRCLTPDGTRPRRETVAAATMVVTERKKRRDGAGTGTEDHQLTLRAVTEIEIGTEGDGDRDTMRVMYAQGGVFLSLRDPHKLFAF